MNNRCVLCDNQHWFLKCNKYKSLDLADRFSLAKEKNLCFNYLKSVYRTQSCNSPNSCFQQDCSKKHHTTLHDGFQEAFVAEHQVNPSITIGMTTNKSNEVYLQIVPVLIPSSTGRREKTWFLWHWELRYFDKRRLCRTTQATWKQNQNQDEQY